MADPLIVKGPEGTIKFPGSMSPEDVQAAMVRLYPPKQAAPSFGPYAPEGGIAGQMVQSIGRAPVRPQVQQLNPPLPRENTYDSQFHVQTRGFLMHREPTVGDYLAGAINVATAPEPGAETGLPEVGTETVQGARRMGIRGERLGGAAQIVGAGGEAISPLMGIAPLEALGARTSEAVLSKAATLAAGLSSGYALSKGSEKAVRALGGGPGAQELAAQLGFWLPAVAGATLSGAIEKGQALPRPQMIESLTNRLMLEGGVEPEFAKNRARELVAMYENTGDAKYLGAENVAPPGARKVLGLAAERALGKTLEAGKVAALGHADDDDIRRLWSEDRGSLLLPNGETMSGREHRAVKELWGIDAKHPETATSAQMGREPAQAPGTNPAAEPISSTLQTTGRGEPVRSTEGPALEKSLADIAKPARDTSTLQQVQTERPEWTLSQQLMEAAKRVQPSAEKGVQAPTGPGLAAPNVVLEARTQEILRKKPGMAEGTARRMAKEQLENERGSLSLRPLPPQIGPQKASLAYRAGDGLQGVADAIGRAFGDLDAVKDTERQARLITRGIDSEKKLLGLQVEEKLKSAIESHDNDGKTEFKAFMDAGEGKPGAQFLKPEDQVVATQLHNEFQKRWVQLNKILDRDPNAGIDNYLSHIWKRPKLAEDRLGQYMNAKRPLAGQGAFLKNRVYQYASEGLDKGLEPLSMNPIRMQTAALFQLDKFITAHELKDAFKDAGLVKWVTVGSKIPDGYRSLSDKIFNPLSYSEQAGGLVKHGTYYAPPEVARIFNRYVEPGLSGHLGYDVLRNYGNTINQLNLGLSGYHGTFISIVAGTSDVGLGLEKIANNHDVGGLSNIFRGALTPITSIPNVPIQALADWLGVGGKVREFTETSSAVKFYNRGKDIQREALSPSPGPKTREQQLLQTYVDELAKSGAIFKQDSFYRTPEGQKFWRGVAQTPWKLLTGHPIDAAKTGYRTMQAGVQRFPITRAIMDYYVPRIKLGMASYMMEAKLQELVGKGIYDQGTIRTEMSKIWDSVDNRAGQMKYDNLFWNKSSKDLSFLAVRAVGWDLGTAREFGGAGVDVLSGLGKLAKGEKPSTALTTRASFVMGSAITLGTMGAIMTYLATGKSPQSALDYFHPPTGRTGTNGKPERYTLPTYAKDVEGLWNHPGKTLINKLHPDIEQAYELYNNRDFLDTQIYDRGGPDPMYQKGADILRWWSGTATPFAATTALARIRGGEGQGPGASPAGIAAESFFGLQRAGREVSSSKAEDYIFDNAKRFWEAGPVSRADRDRRQLFFKFREQQRLGTLDDDALGKALDSGQLQDSDYNRVYKDEGLTNVQSEFKFLASHDISAAVKALQLMTPQERTQYQDQVEQMLGSKSMSHLPEDEQTHYMDEVDKLMQAAPQ